jgi:hypothetical protein
MNGIFDRPPCCEHRTRIEAPGRNPSSDRTIRAPDPSLRTHSPDVIAASGFIPIGDHQQSPASAVQAMDGVDGRWHDRQQHTSKHVKQQNVLGQPAIHAQTDRRKLRRCRWWRRATTRCSPSRRSRTGSGSPEAPSINGAPASWVLEPSKSAALSAIDAPRWRATSTSTPIHERPSSAYPRTHAARRTTHHAPPGRPR